MAEKEVVNVIKLQIEAGKATPAPPVGPALGSSGVNIMQFVKEFNDRTANQPGMIIPVVLTVYADKSFEFVTKVPPVAVLIKKAIKIEKGSGKPNKEKVAKKLSEVFDLDYEKVINDFLEKDNITAYMLNSLIEKIEVDNNKQATIYYKFSDLNKLSKVS